MHVNDCVNNYAYSSLHCFRSLQLFHCSQSILVPYTGSVVAALDLSLNTLERIHTTQDMACVSDIDLATLHRNRLEERVHYKLSWWARRIITDTQKQLKNHRNVILSTGRSLRGRQQQQPTARSTASSVGGALPDTTTIHPSAERCHRGQRINAAESAFNLEQKEREAEQRLLENCCYKKDDYFTTERRRRSGTWP